MTTSAARRIAEDEVHVWIARLSALVPNIQACFDVLPEQEQAWADRFQSKRDQARHVIGRSLVRLFAGWSLGVEPRALRFEFEPFGRPVLLRDPKSPDLRFNVSHSGDFVLAGFTLKRAIGIDVEEISDFDFAPVAARFFSSREQAELSSLPRLEQRDAFFRCWCRKESYVKANGAGLSCPTELFDVSLRPGETAKLIATRPRPQEARRWELRDLDVGPGYAAAMAVEGSGFELKLRPLLDMKQLVE